jgi:hypothetical protein
MHNIIIRIIFPDLILNVWERGRTAKLAFKEFEVSIFQITDSV